MNIFKDFENVAASSLSSILKDSLSSFWKMAGEIKNKLGENELLLNNYLSEAFEVLNCADYIIM